MAADGGDSASFTVRLVNQVMAPARQIKQAMGDVEKSIKSAQRAIAAPAPKRGALSDWDKMTRSASRSAASDWAKQQDKMRQKSQATSQRLAQHHADHGLGAMALEGASDAALGATVAVAAAAAAAAAAIGYMSFKFAEASVEAGMFAQKSELAIGFLTNSGAAAATQFDSVRGMAQDLGLQVNETIGSFERLLAMQFSIGKSKDLIKMAADMQAIGANAEEVQRILYAISEIKSMGTLQKRQERMLQMAGISGELIDKALMSHTGITDKTKLDKARSKGKIGADVAIDAIMDAVMHKTHEHKLGDAGRAFATQTLVGMQAQMTAGLENLYIDSGKRLLPGVTELAQLAGQAVSKIMNDPELAQLGDFLVNEFEIFVLWAKANWPEIQNDLVVGAHAIEGGIRFVIECFDDATVKGQALQGTLLLLAIAFGLLAVGSLVLMAPLYLLIAIIGLLAYAIVQAVTWIADKLSALLKYMPGSANDTTPGVASPLPQMGLGQWGAIPALATPGANDNGIQGVTASAGTQALQSMNTSTESGEERGGAPVHIAQLNVTVPQAEDPQHQAQLIAQSVHTEVAKLIRQAS